MNGIGNVYIRRLDNCEIIHTITVSRKMTDRSYEMFLSGLIRKTNTDRFFVDDSEIDSTADTIEPTTGGQA